MRNYQKFFFKSLISFGEILEAMGEKTGETGKRTARPPLHHPSAVETPLRGPEVVRIGGTSKPTLITTMSPECFGPSAAPGKSLVKR